MEICDNKDNDGNGQIDEGAGYDTDNMALTNESIPTEIYTASQTITTNQTVSVAESQDVHLIAGQSITFKSGFSVATNAIFLAQINGDCTANLQDNQVESIAKIIGNNSPISEEEIITSQVNNNQQVTDNQSTLKIFPNPFKEQTTINFTLNKTGSITLQIFGINGQLVETILSQQVHLTGTFNINFSAQNFKNGMYYFVLTTETEIQTEKVIILSK